MKTVSVLTLLLSLTLLPAFVAEQSQDDGSRYPNELVGYELHEKAKWKSLKPVISTMADVRRVLGNPSEAYVGFVIMWGCEDKSFGMKL